jgi:hypothetical protein
MEAIGGRDSRRLTLVANFRLPIPPVERAGPPSKLITIKLGLFAASLALCHTSPTVTATYYADDTRPKHTGLGKLISPGKASIRPIDGGAVAQTHSIY